MYVYNYLIFLESLFSKILRLFYVYMYRLCRFINNKIRFAVIEIILTLTGYNNGKWTF